MATNLKDEKQYWLMIEDHETEDCDCGEIDYCECIPKRHYWGTPFDSLADLIVWASNNHIALNKCKIVIGPVSKLKLELVN